MRERFLAEARFLKKYKGLEGYLEIYYNSLKQKFRQQYGEIPEDDSSFINRLAELCDLDKQEVTECVRFAALRLTAETPQRGTSNKEFIKHINTIKTIMERL
jgi:hypothetical protein